jgi:hypothetical protein
MRTVKGTDQKYTTLLQPHVQRFILDHANDDENALVLKHNVTLGVPTAWIAEQIAGRRKAEKKLPTFHTTPGILYPQRVALEQASSERTAQFKVALLKATIGLHTDSLKGADLSGGMGIDSFFLSKMCASFDYVEPEPVLLEIARHNHEVLGATNINHHAGTAEAFAASSQEHTDFVFVDPSRRKGGKKLFKLADCTPRITQLLPDLFEWTDLLLVKVSPMLDLLQGLKDLRFVEKISVVSVDNECKELLFLCRKEVSAEPLVHCINLQSHGQASEEFTFSFSDEKGATSIFSDPLRYLYEPNASILKSGAFKIIGDRTGLAKLHPHTHLYTSENLVENFPGRIFRIHHTISDAKKLPGYLPGLKANVVTRNYPFSSEQLKKKLKITDGGEKYLIGFSGLRKKFLVVATRIHFV